MRYSRSRGRSTAWLVAVAVGALLALVANSRPPAPDPSTAQGTFLSGLQPDTAASAATTDGAGASAAAAPALDLPACQAVIDTMPLRDRLAQLIYVGVDTSGSRDAVDAVNRHRVGGVFLRGNSTEPFIGNALATLTAGAPVAPAISVDEEGGRVQRIGELAGPLPSARVMARTLQPEQVRELARTRGLALRAVGVTIDFAPVLDIGDEPDRTAIGDRSFSPDPAVVIEYAGAFAAGLRDSGVLPVLKHFPGHGRASGDSHRGDVVTPSLADLRGADLLPYRQLLGTAPVATMVGHMIVPGLTDGLPASLSPATYQLLRHDYGFTGLAITDDLAGMRAITNRYSIETATLQALKAGADVALLSTSERPKSVLDRLESAARSGELTTSRITEALLRALSAKSACHTAAN